MFGGGFLKAAQQRLEQGEQVRRRYVGAHGTGLLRAPQQRIERREDFVPQRAGRLDRVRHVALSGGLLLDPGEEAEERLPGVVFADLFAADGVLTYPFAIPGQPRELRGRDAIRAYFAGGSVSRDVFTMDGVDAVVRATDDPEVVMTEITHHGQSNVTGEPYRFTALGVIRVRDGEIVRYDDYMDGLAMARLLGRTKELAAALAEA